MKKKLTPDMLRPHNPCETQFPIFCKLCPDGVEMEDKNARRIGHLFDLHWVSKKILSEEGFKEFEQRANIAWISFLEDTAHNRKEQEQAHLAHHESAEKMKLWMESGKEEAENKYNKDTAKRLKQYKIELALIFKSIFEKE